MNRNTAASLHPAARPRLSALLPAACIFLLLPAHAQSGPHLIPQPRQVNATKSVAVHSATIVVPGKDPEDLFAAQSLEASLQTSGVTLSSKSNGTDLAITLLRRDTPAAQQILDREHLAFDPAMDAEGYVLISRPGSATVIGKTSAGIFYGVQTLKQLVERDSNGASIWLATVRDWPAMQYRGIDDDLSRGPFPTLAFMEHQLDVFAAYKVNIYSPYFEHTLRYDNDPLMAPPGSALTRDEARQLVAFAGARHITIVPEQEAFGHLNHLLQYEKYAGLAETPHGNVLAPGLPETLPLIKSWFTQMAEDFPGPFLHVGADETFDLGTGRTKADVTKRGLGPVYADFLTDIHTALAPLHRRLLFWGDVATGDPSAIPHLPKDMIAVPWIYWHQDNYDKNILPFKQAGIETWVAPGDSNWSVVYPYAAGALDNISGFIESGQRLGSTGELTTVWNDDGEGLFNQDWFGVLFSAAAGWQPGKTDSAPYQANFGRRFYGDSTGRIDQAQAEIMEAEKYIGIDDENFWVDPWSKDGLARNARMRAKIPAGRLHAEKAIELIESALATDPTLRETNALKAMELGARRIDFIGLKFQLADEMAAAYAKAYAMRADDKHETETRELLSSISSMYGRCQVLRDDYSMLKDLYRESWLAENRPAWLDNVMVRYDLRIQLWQQRGEAIDLLNRNWQSNHGLPTAHEAGIPDPPTH